MQKCLNDIKKDVFKKYTIIDFFKQMKDKMTVLNYKKLKNVHFLTINDISSSYTNKKSK